MQFDGYPSVKGLEYYSAIVNSLSNGGVEYFTSKGVPNSKFRKRALAFLNNYQYASGHSINNNYTIKNEEWKGLDSWQCWQYLFKLNGDFEISHVSGDLEIKIPWEMTVALSNIGMRDESCDGYKLVEKLFNYYDDDKSPVVILETGEVLAFPYQMDDGWREFSKIIIQESKKHACARVAQSMFINYDGEKRNLKQLVI